MSAARGELCAVKMTHPRSLADEIVNLHAERIGDSQKDGERRIAVSALDLLQRVLVDAGKLRDDAAGQPSLLPDPAYPRADRCR